MKSSALSTSLRGAQRRSNPESRAPPWIDSLCRCARNDGGPSSAFDDQSRRGPAWLPHLPQSSPRRRGSRTPRRGAVDHWRHGVPDRPVEPGDDSEAGKWHRSTRDRLPATRPVLARNPAVTRPRDHSWPNNRFRSLPKTIMVPDHVAARQFRFRVQSTGYGLMTQVRRAV